MTDLAMNMFHSPINRRIFAKSFKYMLTVTEKAKNKAIELMKMENKPVDAFIRVGVEGGGCSGLSYKLEFDSTAKPDDKVFEDKGIKIVCDKKSFLYLIGTELDFSDGLNGKGFQFNNPNASRTCGCGESFAV
jgi:iron-sulfur cluster assembly protein